MSECNRPALGSSSRCILASYSTMVRLQAAAQQDWTASLQTVKQACVPRSGTFDLNRRDTVLDLDDLVADRISPGDFFAENYITEGMRVLLTKGFERLEGHSTQGVFKLTQAMGGGKTHNLLALGLLAKHSDYRANVMGAFYTPDSQLGPVRVVAFSGRESDAPLGIWGAIAEQLGKRDQFNDYYSPLAAPGRTAWVNLLQGDPLIIMLDELPPYLVNAVAKSIGNSDLAAVTTTALANLLVALAREELGNVCVVITDLDAAYEAGSTQINTVLKDLDGEIDRAAMNLEPVRMNTDEFYHILRQRLFKKLPAESEVADVAQGYAATGHALHGRNKGWRKAVRFALTENPMLERGERSGEIFRLVAGEPHPGTGHATPTAMPHRRAQARKNGI